MTEFLQKNAVIIISILSLTVALLGYFLNRTNAKYALRNEFSKRQVEAVISLIETINDHPFFINFTSFGNSGATASVYQGNLFEVEKLVQFIRDENEDFYENPVCFSNNSNQLFELDLFLNNPALPANIADELENFYSRNYQHYVWKDLARENVVVLDTHSFKESIWEKSLDKKNLALWQGNGFAYATFDNFVTCSKNLEKAIYDFLKTIKIGDINFNKHFTHR
jgi:hypothetical protein